MLGVVHRRGDIVLPERHLGLVQAGETATSITPGAIADSVAQRVDLDASLPPRAPRRSTADGDGGRLAAARTAHRARAGRGILVRLSASARRLAARRRRDRAVLAACRRSAAGRTATPSGCRAAIPSCMPATLARRSAFAPACALRRRAADPWRVRRLHGAGRRSRRRRRHAPRDARPARRRDPFRRAALHLGYRRARLRNRAPSWSGTNSTSPLCCRIPTSRSPTSAMPPGARGRVRLAPRRRHRYVLPRHRRGHMTAKPNPPRPPSTPNSGPRCAISSSGAATCGASRPIRSIRR